MKRLLDRLALIALALVLGAGLVALMLWMRSTGIWQFWYGGTP